jgi:hypothetical protein
MHFNPLAIPTVLAAAALLWLGSTLERKIAGATMRRWLVFTGSLLAIPGCLFILYYTHLFDSFAWFYNFRALRFTELSFAGLGFMMGFLHAWFQPERWHEKLIAPITLAALVFVPFMKPVLVPLDLGTLRDDCPGEVCMQSTLSTCGPSSAATILKSFGQKTSEKQLATECYTYRGGTEIWYIARALRRRGFDVHVVIQPPQSTSLPAPAIAGVVLGMGVGHFIAVLDETSDQVTIGDPMKGKLVIKKDELKNYYRFTGFFLVVRDKTGRMEVSKNH